MRELSFVTSLPCAPEDAIAWHARAGALQRLTPPWERVDVVRPAPSLTEGTAELGVWTGPVRRRWVARHEAIPGGFRDTQERGPFASFQHDHVFRAEGEGTRLEDRVRYRLPLGLPARLVEERLARMFAHRAIVLQHDLAALATRGPARTILVSGASGLIGSAACAFWSTQGHRVVRLVRHEARAPDERAWDPRAQTLDTSLLDGIDAVVHLAGEPISRRWTEERKREILASRSHATKLLADAIARAPRPPAVLVSASAIGYHGDRGDALLDDTSPRGSGFLADVVEAWEAATRPAADAGVRVVHARFGIVLSARGGALPRLLRPARLGGGGPVGSGRQWWSWVDIEDVVGALDHAVRDTRVEGPMLVVAPNPVRCREFARVLGRVLHRPSFVPLPGFAARAMLGEMAEELLLFSARGMPGVLQETGYRFRCPELESSLRAQTGR